MKKYFFLLLISSFSIVLSAQDKSDMPFLTKSFAGASIKNVESKTSGGNITVIGSAASEPKIEVFVWPSNKNKNASISKEEIQKRLDEDYNLTISAANGKLIASAERKKNNNNWKNALSISFKIYVPANISSELTTSGGNIDLTELNGTQHFTTSGGSLHIDKLKGNIRGRTSGGSIYLKDCADDIDLSTSGGSIEANNCTGKIKLITSGGSLRLNDLNGIVEAKTSGGNVHGQLIKGDLLAHTSGGNIDLQKLSCSLETSTSGGNVHVEIAELGKYVRISNSGGNIDAQIPNKGIDLKVKGSKIRTDMLTNFSGSVEDDEINGKLNGGGIPVTITNSGRINLVVK
jgi:hypothetical protein